MQTIMIMTMMMMMMIMMMMITMVTRISEEQQHAFTYWGNRHVHNNSKKQRTLKTKKKRKLLRQHICELMPCRHDMRLAFPLKSNFLLHCLTQTLPKARTKHRRLDFARFLGVVFLFAVFAMNPMNR
uniref:Secreted protein n=1 Tax=Glossina pallidipes TaxID=7398 RepID=A0A1B0AHL2_GLOPL